MFPTPKIAVKETPASKEKFWNCWKLKTHNGRQVWEFEPPEEFDAVDFKEMSQAFEFNKAENPNSGDKVYRYQCLNRFQELYPEEIPGSKSFLQDVHTSFLKGLNFYKSLQTDEGHFPGDYGGPMFLLPGLLIASYVTETPFPPSHRELMLRYMPNHQNDDGGWGLHIEGPSTMFATVMQYVALRISGMSAEEPLTKARKWILANGGAVGR